MSDEYYLQESSHVCGNDMMFWRKNRCGYTTNIDDAQVFTKAEAFEQANRRNTDIPWEKSYIDSKAHRAVNIQNVRFEE